MKVTVVYTTQIKAALDMAEESVEVADGATAVDLLRQLADQHGETFANLVFTADGPLLPSMLLCVGDEQLTDPEEQSLSDGDVVTLLSAISGG